MNKPTSGNVYIMTGEDGKLYAGQTTQPLARRLSQHKNNKKLSNKMFLYAEKHGLNSLSMLHSQQVSENELNAAEERLITENHCIENGLNTNHAPKKRTRNEFTKMLHSYCGRYTLGDKTRYRMSDLMNWAKSICAKYQRAFDFESFVNFISVGYAKDAFFIDMVGAGDGYYVKRSAATIQKMLTESPELADHVMLYTNRVFFTDKKDRKILAELNNVSKELLDALNHHDALDRARNSMEVAKYLNAKNAELIEKKTNLEQQLRTVAFAF